MVYTRWDTEIWHDFEEALATLEHANLPALTFASGMAAISACYSLLPTQHELGRVPVVVVPRHAYHATLVIADGLAQRHGVEVRRVDIDDTDAVIAALDGADLAMIESPTNPMLEVCDLPLVLKTARALGVLTVVDNTFATPLGQTPLDFGADVIIHSATKYLAGHSDVVIGVAVTNSADLRAKLLSWRTIHGAIAGPFEVFLALRGLRTLPLRFERANANAQELAARLAAHPLVAEVRHPSLPGDKQHKRAAATMNAFGAIIGLRPVGGLAATEAFISALQLWVPATSLGGVESSLERRRRWPSESTTVPEDFMRLSVGIENVEDLWADLDQALAASQ
jgi:cystathionine gamma-synthase